MTNPSLECLERLENYLNEHKIERFADLQLGYQPKILGCGGSSIIYHTTFQGKNYALKSYNINVYMDDKTIKKFIKELKIFQKVDHPNIIKFYGVSQIQGGRLFFKNFMFVLQFAKGGSLRDHLKAKRQNNSYEISWNELINIAKDIVLGLTYLHSKGIIHRDLHSNNILIDDDKALIADFGISKQLNDTSISSSGAIGMLPYIDPQCIHHNQKPAKESDIYSVGVLLWELTSGRPPSYNPIKATFENVPSVYIVLYEECRFYERDKRPKLESILSTLDRLSREVIIKSIISKDTIDENCRISSNFPNESRSILSSGSSSYKTTISNFSSFFSNKSYSSFSSRASTESYKTPSSNFLNDFPFELPNFDDPSNLIRFKHVIEGIDIEKLPRELLIGALKSLSVAPEFNAYKVEDVAYLELRLRTLKAILEIVYYFGSLKHEFRNELLNNFKTYIDFYYRLVNSFNQPNYNINFLLIHLYDTLLSVRVDEEVHSGRYLEKSIAPEMTIHVGVSMPTEALNILQNIEASNFSRLAGWYKEWRNLLNVRHSLEISTKQNHGFLQYHQEIFLFEFFRRHVLDHISNQVMPATNISKGILNSKNEFLYVFNKKKPISSFNSLWFGTLDLVQDICYTTTEPAILAVCYYFGLESLRKSQCINIKFKSLEILLSLLFKKPEQFHNTINEIREYCDTQFEFLIDIVRKKISIDDDLIMKSKHYISIFQEKYSTKKIVTLLKDIIKEKITCTTSKKLNGDFVRLECGHTISRLAIGNQKLCPFCKTDLDIELIYNFSSNAVLKGFYEKLEDFDEQQIPRNILPKSTLFKKAKDAEEQERYSEVLLYLDQLIQFYPKSNSYHVQCCKANAMWELGLKENLETAIKLHVKARDILTLTIKLKPKKSLAYICRGKIYLYHNNNAEALRDFELAQKFGPNNIVTYLYKLMMSKEAENSKMLIEEQVRYKSIVKRKKFNLISTSLLLTTIKPSKMIFGLGNSLPVKLYSLDDSTISGYVLLKVFKKFQQAIKSCTQAISLNDRNVIALGIRGISYHKMGNREIANLKNNLFSNALTDFNKVLKMLPNNKSALGLRGKLYSSMGKYDEGLNDLNKAIDSNNEDFDNCEFHFNKMLVTEKNEIFIDRGEVYLFKQEYENALKDLNKSLNFEPNNARALRIRGTLYRRTGEDKEALEDFEQSLRKDTDNESVKRNIMDLYRKLGNYNKAEEYLIQFFDRNDADLLRIRGELCRRLEKYEEAFRWFTESLNIKQNDPGTLISRGATFRMMGRYKDALNDVNKSLEIDLNNESALQQRGIIFYMMGDYVSALSDFEKVLESSNSTQNLYNQCIGYRGAVNFKLGLSEQNRLELFKQSQSDLENAIKLKPKEPYWHCQLGALLYEQGDHDNSLKELIEAIELFKSSPLLLETKFRKLLISEAYHYRGLLYKAKGDYRMANSDFKEYQNLIRIT